MIDFSDMKLSIKIFLKRFISFFSIGLVALIGDVALGYGLMYLGVPTMIAIGFSFLLSLSLSYGYVRTYSFFGTTQDYHRGYVYFIIIALGGLGITLVGTSYLVKTFGLHPSLARFCMSAVSGAFNFSINGLYNFRVFGAKRAIQPDNIKSKITDEVNSNDSSKPHGTV
jgi:putative flippase GtrA